MPVIISAACRLGQVKLTPLNGVKLYDNLGTPIVQYKYPKTLALTLEAL